MQRFLKPLTLSLVLAALTSSSALAQGTVFVNSVLNPFTNGTALLTALAGIPGTAGPNEPYMIKLEPGIYDLGGAQLVMRNFVDIEGSGRDVTTIRSTSLFVPANLVLVSAPAGVEAELRELTLQNTTPGNGTGISIATSDFLLTEVNIEVEAGGSGVGVLTTNSSPRLNEVFVRMDSGGSDIGVNIIGGGTVITESFVLVSSFGAKNFAISIDSASTAVLERVVAFAILGDVNFGVVVSREAIPELNNVRALASGGEDARGLYAFKDARPEVKESTFTAASDTLAIAASLEDGQVLTTESTYRASGVSIDHLNVYAARLTGSSNLSSNQSNWDGSSFAVSNSGSGIASFGASQLIGQVITTSLTGLRCIYAYRGNYTARNATCG